MEVITYSEARNNLRQLLESVIQDADYKVIKLRDSKDDAVVLSLATFNGYLETFHLLSSPANAAHLSKSIQQYQKGKTKKRNLVHE